MYYTADIHSYSYTVISMTYSLRTFNLPELAHISQKQIDVHLGLYSGYVTHTNLIMEKIAALTAEDATANAFVINELRRRLGFEFCGMRLHEYYFEQFEGGAHALAAEMPLVAALTEKYGGVDEAIAHIRSVAGTRGIGWVVMYQDPAAATIHTAWVDDHQLGQLAGLPILLALDLWEHAFMIDYVPAEKKSYVDAFLENLNWLVVANRFES